jgi:hypothetical protein
MRIRITRKGTRNQLACVRSDGTHVVADLGPNLPYHDLAHFVVEREFRLQHGFFGNIARGYSPAQLSDKGVILSLGAEPYRAEILARGLGALATGACESEQFEELVNAELSLLGVSSMRIPTQVREAMMLEFKSLGDKYACLQEGESLHLEFDVEINERLSSPNQALR